MLKVMAIEIKAPNSYSEYKWKKYTFIFAGGSIEMDKAAKWQPGLTKAFSDHDDVVILNPRRDHWNINWEQVAENPEFRQQVDWELSAMEMADFVIINLLPDTLAPVSLLEAGLFMRTAKLMVVCPKGFWRKGNIDITCKRYGVPVFDKLEDAVTKIKDYMARSTHQFQKNR